MINIYFHPDIDYQGVKDIENKYTSIDKDYLIIWVSRQGPFILEKIN